MTTSTESPTPGEESPGAGLAPDRAQVAGETLTAPAAAGVRIPDFFIVGHEKCGTTSLYKILRQHPQIFMPDLKEPRFFTREHRVDDAGDGGGIRPRTLEDYLSLFADAGPAERVGEASPQYIRSKESAGLIADLQPAARIIAVLREPTSFLQTYHSQNVRGRIETERDFRAALELEPSRRRGEQIPRGSRAPGRLMYSEHVRYVEQLRRFHAVFRAEHVMVIIYEDFRRDNDATVREVLRFLDVDDTVQLERVVTKRTRKAVRFQPLYRLAFALQRARRRPAAAGRLSRTIDALTPRQLRSDAIEDVARRIVFSVPDPPDERFMLELRRRFKPEVQALSEYLGRDLVSFWGYDDVD
jgi:Sulfotransferase family